MSFLTLTPYTKVGHTLNKDIITSGKTYKKGTEVNKEIYNKFKDTVITLHVIDTPKVTRNFSRNKVKTFNTGAGNKSAHIYYSTGDAGFTFTVKCLIRKKDILKDGKTAFHYLNNYFTNGIQVSIVMNTEVVPNGVYDISNFTEYAPIRKDYYEAEIEFTKHVTVDHKLTNKCTVLQSYLKQCKKPNVKKVYTAKQIDAAKKGKPLTIKIKKKDKNGKVVTKTKAIKPPASTCVGRVNEVLYTLGMYGPSKPKDGTKAVITLNDIKKYDAAYKNWKKGKKYYQKYKNYWTKTSVKGLKKFQKRWNKRKLKPKLKTNGKLDTKTWKALLRYPEVKK